MIAVNKLSLVLLLGVLMGLSASLVTARAHGQCDTIRIERIGHFRVVTLTADGTPVRLLLDWQSPTSLSESKLRRLGYLNETVSDAPGARSRRPSSTVYLKELRLGLHTNLPAELAMTTQLELELINCLGLDGVLGWTSLRDHAWRFDFGGDRLLVCTQLEVVLRTSKPTVEVNYGGRLGPIAVEGLSCSCPGYAPHDLGRLPLDLREPMPLVLNEKNYPLDLQRSCYATQQPWRFLAPGSATELMPSTHGLIRFFNWNGKVDVMFPQTPYRYAYGSVSHLGMGLLNHVELVFSHPVRRLLMVPKFPLNKAPDLRGSWGLLVGLRQGRVVVTAVEQLDRLPSELQPGLFVHRFDGQAIAHEGSLCAGYGALLERLRQTDRPIELELRDSQGLTLQVRLSYRPN